MEISFRTKLLVAVCALVLLTGALTTLLAFRSARASTRALAERVFREGSAHAVAEARSFLGRAGPLVKSLAQLSNDGLALDDSGRLTAQLLAILRSNDGLSWVSYGDRDGWFAGAYRPVEGGMRVNQSWIVDGRTLLLEHDVGPGGDWTLFRRVEDSGYDPRVRPFYTKAAAAGQLVWLPPYVFYNQGVAGVSCATPVLDSAGQIRGVLSVDFDLHALSQFIAQLSVSENSRFTLFTDDGLLLATPGMDTNVGQRPAAQDALVKLADLQDPGLHALDAQRGRLHAQDPQNAFTLFEFRDDAGREQFASITAFAVGDLLWMVGATAPTSDFLAEVWSSQRIALMAAAMALGLAVLLSIALARRVSGPVQSLTAFMQGVGEGELGIPASFTGSREFNQLSVALNKMIGSLRDHVRLRHSLQVATDVQQRLLPPGPPTVPALDMAGHSTYCEQTGGDYYDFLVLEPQGDRVLIAVGDVMGHGVAAALLMAGIRAILHDRAGETGRIADMMTRLNAQLARDTEGTRFMTMYLAILDPGTRLLRWASAGHDPAIIHDPASGRFDEIEGGGLPLGVEHATVYKEYSYGPLRPGQVLMVGTDGIWEAMSKGGEFYGKDRLRAAIASSAGQPAAAIIDRINLSLKEFLGDIAAKDDVTMLVVKIPPTASPWPEPPARTSPSIL
jgi:sigma-B regulation protein RsbU (phosphoserine phosphatase)